MKIDTATRADYPALIELWEASVRATHHFLQEAEILALKPLILEHYFDAVTLHSARTEEGQITGFSGVYEGKLEMLFVAPEARGSGMGRLLVAMPSRRAARRRLTSTSRTNRRWASI